MEGYSVNIRTCSKELSAKERIKLKDTTNAIQLDKVTDSDSRFVFEPDYYAVLDVHNEKSKDKDYVKYIIVCKDGTKLVTGSESFWSAFKDIASEMADCDEEYSIEAYRMPSKNYSGKDFITCSLL